MRTALITGVNGQDGSYLAEQLLTRGYRVIGVMRNGASSRYELIDHIRARIDLVHADLLDDQQLRMLLAKYRPAEVYNFAARASSAHLYAEPVLTGESNGMAVLRLLEAIRVVAPTTRLFQASSSEMYGEPPESPQSETTRFLPESPYGIAKLFAHGMIGVYRRRYGIFACSGILFNHESPRRGTEFVTRKVTMGVAQIKVGKATHLRLGNLQARRDWGYSADYVDAMWRMLQADVADDYVIATGASHSVADLCDVAFSHVGLDYRDYVELDVQACRGIESMPLVGNAAKLNRALGWRPTVSFRELIRMMVDSDLRAIHGHI